MGHGLMPTRNTNTVVYLATINQRPIEGWEKEGKNCSPHRQE